MHTHDTKTNLCMHNPYHNRIFIEQIINIYWQGIDTMITCVDTGTKRGGVSVCQSVRLYVRPQRLFKASPESGKKL